MSDSLDSATRLADLRKMGKAKKDSPEARNARIALYAERAAQGLDIFTGQPRHPDMPSGIDDDE